MRGVAFALGVVACDAAPTRAPAPAPEPPPPPVNISSEIELRWSNIKQTDGCFFFSGPEGRDDQLQGAAILQRSGATTHLHVGRARFDGIYRGGELMLYRVSPHDFGGPWLAFETIKGTYTEREMRATYRYQECEGGGPCPGRCEIRADLVLAVR